MSYFTEFTETQKRMQKKLFLWRNADRNYISFTSILYNIMPNLLIHASKKLNLQNNGKNCGIIYNLFQIDCAK